MDGPYEEGQDYCRICRGEASPSQPLFYPCKCSGSIKFVHQQCLMEWLSHSQKKHCELCKTSFRFTKLYDRHMPTTLPFPLFLRQLVRHGLRGITRWIRYFMVGVIWTCCQPWCIRQVWRGMLWFADGSWLDEHTPPLATVAASNATTEFVALNFTVPEYLERIKLVLPPMQISLADIARVFFSQGLIGRLFQLIVSAFMPGSRQNAALSTSNGTLELSSIDRHPSLLSDVGFLASWSSSPIVNSAVVDIVEGQLICVSLITAFILVFLIREWVINQQPILNMPDPDQPEAIQPDPPATEEVQPPDQERGDANFEGEPVGVAPARPIAIPRLRRALTDDNILTGTGNELTRPTLPVRSQSLVSEHGRTESPDAEDAVGESSAVADEFDSRPFRRHSLSNSILVQRGFEVAPGSDSLDLNDQDTLSGYFQAAASSNDTSDPPDARHLDQLVEQEMEPPALDPAGLFPRRVSFAAGEEIIDQPIAYSTEHNLNADETDLESLAIPTPDSGETENVFPPGDSTFSDGERESSNQANEPANQDPIDEPSVWAKIGGWLWHAETQNNIQVPADAQQVALDEAQNRERALHDLFGGPPPFARHNIDAGFDAEPAVVEAAPVADGLDPNFLLGVDLNDPNAAEDAEDLDGILELLGMEGPIFGMVQNVIFSLFLLTLTLTASVWCPYIWGKIALLFLHRPIMLIKVPLYALSTVADVVIDVLVLVAGLAGFLLNQPVKVAKAIISQLFPAVSNVLDTTFVEGLALDVSQKSAARLERALSGAFLNLTPDLPTFSVLSHHALRSSQASVHETVDCTVKTILGARDWLASGSLTFRTILFYLAKAMEAAPRIPEMLSDLWSLGFDIVRNLPANLTSMPAMEPFEVDDSLGEWTTEDRILTIILGYAFFALTGVVFLEIAHVVLGLKHNERVEGYLADCLRQAGGVMKVIVIIGIEMLVFPLYCGLLLDLALLPLFADATFASRIAFMSRTPFTGIFIHWFIGTCYMFHFALFVSICRKIMRTGVLYFIRDPDDPTFHPIRDVLERPIPAQLGKIAFSALVYGGLVIVCLGGVVWSLDGVGSILPIQWATSEPRLAFPVDVVFYNFMLPFVLRRAEPPKKISAMYKWWFQGCARALRLTNFMFGEECKDETYSRTGWYSSFLTQEAPPSDPRQDGLYVRAPASDSVRIPKGHNVFLEVTEQNERVDGQPDLDFGNHGVKDPRFIKVYLPPRFKVRIATFIFLLWVFAAATGVALTIGPLLIGRTITRLLSDSSLPPNDLYAFTIGIHIFAALGYALAYARPALQYLKTMLPQWSGSQIIAFVKYILGLVYLGVFTILVLPFVIAMITELYVHVPLFTYLELGREKAPDSKPSSQPVATIFILQSWTVGLLYLRLLARLCMKYVGPDRPARTALRATMRDGLLKPDVRLASRAFVLPAAVICVALLSVPLVVAKAAIVVLQIHDSDVEMRLYRLAYPGVLGLVLAWLAVLGLQQQVASWRVKIRDEVYLIGERLHNFHDPASTKVVKGKEKEKSL